MAGSDRGMDSGHMAGLRATASSTETFVQFRKRPLGPRKCLRKDTCISFLVLLEHITTNLLV